MRTSDFDYRLPQSFIAQHPLEPRDSSRLLVLHRGSDSIDHRVFHQIGEYLQAGDVLVLNRTRVIPARVYARKPTGGRVELLLLRRRDRLTWEVLVGGRGLTRGKSIELEQGPRAEILSEANGSERVIRFEEPNKIIIDSNPGAQGVVPYLPLNELGPSTPPTSPRSPSTTGGQR